MLTSPNGKAACYSCPMRRNLPGDCHSSCSAVGRTRVAGNPHGVAQGWFLWPLAFDPIWLERCTLFEAVLEAAIEAARSAHEKLEARIDDGEGAGEEKADGKAEADGEAAAEGS